MDRRLVLTVDVVGRPSTFATAGERPWKEAVREAIRRSGCSPLRGRFAVDLEFRLGESRNANEVWDLDNLIKPTLDAMEGIFGLRPWRGVPQPADDQVDEITARKRLPILDESPGAAIRVWLLDHGDSRGTP